MAKSDSTFQIGIATVDITPPGGVKLAGYGPRKGAPSTALGHTLRAEALVCKGTGGAWALVTSDTIGYPRELVMRVRERIAAQTDLRPEQILISATHTHSGPAAMRTYSKETTQQEDAYRQELEARLAQVVVDASKALRPGAFEVAWTEAPDLAHNRRVVHDDGTAENDWLDEDGRHTGYFDPAVMLVAVRRPDGTRDALLVNYGCHPVVLGPRSFDISADYPGYLKDLVEAQHPGMAVMFALAGGGNINPRLCIQVGAEHPKRMGETLGKIVLAAMDNLRPVAVGPVASSQQLWSFASERQWPEGSQRKKGDAIETEIMALRAGDLALVSLPGELFSEYAAMLREASPVPETVVVSLANDASGYLPVDAAMAQGGHEVTHRAASDGVEGPMMATARKAFAAVAD